MNEQAPLMSRAHRAPASLTCLARGLMLCLAVATAASGVVGTELRLYPVAMETPAASVDMQKQIITALITLLTSVVSFYFGSRTVEAAAKGITGLIRCDQHN